MHEKVSPLPLHTKNKHGDFQEASCMCIFVMLPSLAASFCYGHLSPQRSKVFVVRKSQY